MQQNPQSDVAGGTQALREVAGAGENQIREYLVYRPTQVPENGVWPVLLFLHGRGEARSNHGVAQGINAVKKHQTPPWLCEQADWNHPFIIISPQLPNDVSRWHEAGYLAATEAIVNNAIETYQGDPNRVYVTGFSIGALGTIAIAAQANRLFAALLPVDAYDPAPQWANRKVTNQASINTPLWSHRGANNGDAPIAVGLINQNAVENTYQLKHTDICRTVYENPEVYAWLLGNAR